ncbi:hypothetical protein ABZ863_06080 [Saccharomonospora sp. NPDC046836]|uniref:hypothetical protein n=1 Tax=Saccharomonospora sp. NPDC046836 TaxID=3156921 RepID=UPI0033FD9478
MSDDPYFGYDFDSLRELQTGGSTYGRSSSSPWYTSSEAEPTAATPAPDDSDMNFRLIYQTIKNERPGTAENRGRQWAAVATMLNTLKTQVRDQVSALDPDWASPTAKEAFLEKIGRTLAYVELWRQAAWANAGAHRGLAEVMREYQLRIEALKTEYDSDLAQSRRAIWRYLDEYTTPETTMEDIDQLAREHNWEHELPHDEFDQRARQLLSEMAGEYLPYLSQLNDGRPLKLEPFNAVLHPTALGTAIPDLTVPGLPPTDAPAVPVELMSALSVPPPPAVANGAVPTPPSVPTPPPVSTSVPDVPDVPTAPSVPVPPVPTAPTVPTVGVPGGVMPLGFGGAAMAGLIPGITGLTTPRVAPNVTAPRPAGGLGQGFGSQTPSGLASPASGLPPGTLRPPMPPGMPGQQAQRKKDDKKPQVPPGTIGGRPPGGMPSSPQAPAQERQPTNNRGARPNSGVPAAFQPPLPPTSPVFNAPDRKRNRPGGRHEAPLSTGRPIAGAPAVLANPQSAGKPATEQITPAHPTETSRRQQGLQPEFDVEAPAAGPVLESRETAAPQSVGEIPVVLRTAPAAPETPDHQVRPMVPADQAPRVAGEKPLPANVDQAAWEVQTPGGPVVSGEREVKRPANNPAATLGRT